MTLNAIKIGYDHFELRNNLNETAKSPRNNIAYLEAQQTTSAILISSGSMSHQKDINALFDMIYG